MAESDQATGSTLAKRVWGGVRTEWPSPTAKQRRPGCTSAHSVQQRHGRQSDGGTTPSGTHICTSHETGRGQGAQESESRTESEQSHNIVIDNRVTVQQSECNPQCEPHLTKAAPVFSGCPNPETKADEQLTSMAPMGLHQNRLRDALRWGVALRGTWKGGVGSDGNKGDGREGINLPVPPQALLIWSPLAR